MNHKRDMHRVIHLLLLLLSQYTELIYSDSDPLPNQSENPVKRYNLQDLISQAGVQLTPGLSEQEDHASKPQTIDVSELLSAAKTAASRQDAGISSEDLISRFTKPKPVDIDLTADKNGNLNLADIPGLTRAPAASNPMNTIDLSSLLGGQHPGSSGTASNNDDENHVVKEEFNLGKQKLEVEAAGKRTTRYTLAKGPDGGLNLIPIVDPSDQADRKYEVMQPKGYEEGAKSRQQMQLTTLSQALYSPFPSEANILHLHLKGKDGKDGKAGIKGPMGGFGPKGPEGPKGPKGDAGTCSAQINGLFECTPDELDSLSNRVDYLEKICKKVENAAKKHVLNLNEIASKPSTLVEPNVEVVPKKEASTKSEEPAPKVALKEVKEEPKEDKAAVAEKEKERLKQEAKEAIEKEVREEVARRLKEQLTLKLEKEVQEKGNTRSTPDDAQKTEKQKPIETEQKQEIPITLQKPKEIAEVKSKDVSAEDSKKETAEPAKKSKDASPPTLRSMIDIRAKLKIAELDLMDRVNQAKSGATQHS